MGGDRHPHLPIHPRNPNITAMDQSAPRPTKRCPICGKPTLQRFRPFCSKRCADIDLHRWLGGRYAVPVVEEDASAETGEREDDGS
jgi:hypothetical protein